MCPSLIEIGSKTAEKNSAQTNRQTDRHYENNGHFGREPKMIFLNNFLIISFGTLHPIWSICRKEVQVVFLKPHRCTGLH